ncbi:hypothetical protein [Alkalicoccobacillus murimartini]|uniref:Uncharacterized protein n=1 Tax=Alkalicoccobacillus murimartini TaxID=171685 RepID=A0ABT9YIC0_9BACI|nr:hypothetical protein [Alkalicoccobacillus murimartini]MDQ0207610.1 hypothetical protein [Alkalicoccobacillus murimartini]
MFRKRTFSLLLLVGLIILVELSHSKTSFALDCAETSADESYERANVVFSGNVTKVQEYTYTFAVEDVYKGSVEETVEVMGSEWDGDFFKSQEKMLVYTDRMPFGQYTMELCSRTGFFNDLQEDVQGIPPTEPTPKGFLSTPILVGSITGLVGLSILVIRRCRNRS